MRRFALAAALVTLALAASPTAADTPLPIVGPHERIGGHTLAEWMAIDVVRTLAIPYTPNDGDVPCIPTGDGGPVSLFGANATDGHVRTIFCTVPAGRYIMLGGASIFCSNLDRLPGYRPTARGKRRCAHDAWHTWGDPHPRLVVDGVPVEPAGYYVATKAFRFKLAPRQNIFGTTRTRGIGAEAGNAVLLRPLPPGQHKIVSAFRLRGSFNRVAIVRLTVG
jgi:hypothetical protein